MKYNNIKKIVVLFMTSICFIVFNVGNGYAFSHRLSAPSVSAYDKSNPYSVGQCTWYAWGRAREILGKTPKVWKGNAGAWFSYNKSKGWYSWGSTPKEGSIMVTHKKGYSSDIGHVAIVEAINGDKMTISEYNWNISKGFDTATLKTNVKTRGSHEVVGYIYLLDEKPSKPSITSFEAKSTSSIEISWKSVSGATKYRIDRRKKGEENYKTITSSCTSTSYTDKNLSAGSLYYYRVYAINSAGTSPRSETYAAYTKPSTPKEPNVNIDSRSQMTISWNKVSGATHYKLLCRTGSESKYEVIANNLTGTTYTHKGLSAGTRHCYKVVAVVKASLGEEGKRKTVSVESAQSDMASKYTTATKPSNTVDNNNPTHTILEWNAAKGQSSGYTYEIWRNGKRIGTTKNTEYIDKTGTSGTIYQYEIKINGSSWTTGKFYAGPKMTSRTTVTPESTTSVRISWSKPIGGSNLTYRVKKQVGDEYVDLGDTSNTYYIDKGLKTGEFYKYYIQVRDKDGNYITSNINGSTTLEILPTKITLNKSAATLNEGDSLSLSTTITPSNSTSKSVSWSSSNSNIAAVSSNGAVTAKAAGSAVITAKTSNGITASCTITVQPNVCAHEYGEWITEKDATCTEEGSRYRVCTKCGEGRETEVVPALGHTFSEEWIVTKEATCTEAGEQVHVCAVCGTSSDAETIDALGHSYPEDWTLEQEATCTEAGIESRACTVCGEKEERSTEYAEHTYELTSQTDPTLTGPGSRTYTCSVCGNNYSEEYVPLLEEGIIDVGGVAASAGQTVTISVTISENPGIAGFNFVLKYDNSVLTPTAITKGSMLSSGIFETNLNEGIPASELEDVAVYWGDATNVTENGELFSVTFKIDGNAPDGIYEVALEYEKGDVTDQTYNDVMPDIHTNVIQVADVLKGDINLDGNVDPLDSILMSKVLARYKIELTEKQIDAANVFNDKEKAINTKDAVSLAQIIAGWENPVLQSVNTVQLFAENAESMITVEGFEAAAGEYIDIPISITNNPGIAGFNFTINYDKEKLTPVAIEKSDMLIDGNFASNLEETEDGSELDMVTASWSDTDPVTEDGALFNVMFIVSDSVTVGETLPIEISYDAEDICDRYLNSIEPTVEQGKIEVTEYTEEDPGNDIVTEAMPYYITDVYMQLSDGTMTDKVPEYGNFELQIGVGSTTEEYIPAVMIAAAYDENGKLISMQQTEITEDLLAGGICSAHIPESVVPVSEVKVFIWDSLGQMKPVADPIVLQQSWNVV